MHPEERLGLAQQAYLRAVALARADSTPWSWGRLLTAAKNLGTAKQDRARGRSGPKPASRADKGKVPAPGAERRVASPPTLETARRAELAREWDRARLLRAQSRLLGAQTRALCASIAKLMARWQGPRATPGA